MSKFIITCPACHHYAQASTGFFASKYIRCACGNIIDVKTDRMATRACPSCGNNVVYDQSEGARVKCPICQAQLLPDDAFNNLVQFRCSTCGCELHADKSAKTLVCPICDTCCDIPTEIKKEEMRNAGIPAVISYEGDNATFIWKHPMTDFVTGSQLIVHESQEAIFFRNGEALDSFGAGRYTLETGILPKMDSLFHVPTQGQPFQAEVYFINLTTQMGIKWGTPTKIGLFDPATGLHVELGASGAFNLRVTDARKLLIKLVGTTGGLTQGDVYRSDAASPASGGVTSGYFRTMIAAKVKSNLARIIKNNRMNVLELDERLDAVSLGLREAINAELAEYGLETPEFYVANIVTPDEDPAFRRMKQQHAELYLKTREEEIKKAEAEAAFERKAVEAQTAARMKVIGAQGDADSIRIKAQADAEAYRMRAEAEAQEMRMKGYTYQQETARQVGIEAMKNGGSGSAVGGVAGDAMQLGLGLGVVGSVIGMTKDAVTPVTHQMGEVLQQATNMSGWDCACGQKGVASNFCPVCGAKRPDAWDCTCGSRHNTTPFCPNCGKKQGE